VIQQVNECHDTHPLFLKSMRIKKLLSVMRKTGGVVGSYVHALSVRSAVRAVGVKGSTVDDEGC